MTDPVVPQAQRDQIGEEAGALWDEQIRAHGRMTNMKRTLAHSPLALRVLMEWYPLRDALVPVLGARAVTIFAHAISSATDCLICSTFFRRLLREAGEDPDHLRLDARESLLVGYGRHLAKDPNRIPDTILDGLKSWLTPPQLVELTAFAGLMVATNLFNNALRVPLDDYLTPFRR